MSRPDADRLDDIAVAITSIHSHLQHGPISVGTNPEILQITIDKRLAPLAAAIKPLKGLLPPEG